MGLNKHISFYRVTGPLICVDCEFIPGPNILTEIGFCEDGKTTVGWLIKPSKRTGDAIKGGRFQGMKRMSELTGITLDNLVNRGITVGALKKKFDRMSLHDKTLVHWGGPDPFIIGKMFKRYFKHQSIPHLHFLDLQIEWSRWKMTNKMVSLSDVARSIGINTGNHRATKDAEVTYSVLSYMKSQGWTPNGEMRTDEVYCKDPSFVYPTFLTDSQIDFLKTLGKKNVTHRKRLKTICKNRHTSSTKDCAVLHLLSPSLLPLNENTVIGLSQIGDLPC